MHSLELARSAAAGHLSHRAHGLEPPYRAEADSLPAAHVDWVGPGYNFELADDYRLEIDEWVIEIPAGFRFNAASVPRVAWAVISPLDLGIISVLVHDWTYAGRPVEGMSRSEADSLFKRLMKLEGVPWWKRQVAYGAVRAFGGERWGDDS